MGFPAARLTDLHICPLLNPMVMPTGGPIITASPNVVTMGLPQARVNDICLCTTPPDTIALGSFTVMVNGQPAARLGPLTSNGGVIILGAMTVLIGP